MTDQSIKKQVGHGSIVTIRAFDEFPEHQFEVDDVFDDCVSGYSLNGPLESVYGEPEWALIKEVVAGNSVNPADD